MGPSECYERLRKAVCFMSDIGGAQQAYADLGTQDNVRKCLEIAVGDVISGQFVIDFILNHKLRDSSKAPMELRNINLRKMIDEIRAGDVANDNVKLYVPQKKRMQHVFGLTKENDSGKIEE